MRGLGRGATVLFGLLLAVGSPHALSAAQESPSRTFAVRTSDADLAEAVENGPFVRWLVPREAGLEARVGPEAAGDVVVEAWLLPAPEEVNERWAGLPVRFPATEAAEGDAFRVGQETYRDRRMALAVRLPGADAPRWLVAGWEVGPTARVVDWVLRAAAGESLRGLDGDFDFLIYETFWSLRTGTWRRATDGRWQVAPGGRDDLAARRRAYDALETLDLPGLRLRVPEALVDSADLRAVARRWSRSVGEMAARVPVELKEPLEVVFEDDYVAMGRHLGRVGAAVVEAESGRLHAVFDPRDEEPVRHGLAHLLLERAGWSSAEDSGLPPWLADGAALWLSREWYGRTFVDWLPDLLFARVLPTTPELLAEEKSRDGSDVLWPPVAAGVVAGLPGETLTAKLAPPPGEITVERLLRGLERQHPPAGDTARQAASAQARAQAPAHLPFLRGVSLAMPPGLEFAYHSPGVGTKLETLREMGSDAVAVMPYAFMRSVDRPELHSRVVSPTDETDVGLLHAARRAHERGFRVLWKPHVYVWGEGWVGEVAMTSEDDWRAWWRRYRRYVVHHAVLAAHGGAELMAVGVELGGTLERQAEWRDLISAVRRVYPGHLTYAGNWWGDFDRAPFWDALDFVGVDAYFPLAGTDVAADPAGDETLAAGVRRMMEQVSAVARRVGKKVLFTEVGFAAHRHAWASPHEEGGEYSAEDQHRAYRLLLETLGRPEWLGGVFFWKVFSNPGVAGENDTHADFRFLGRPAQEAVERYFSP